MVAPSIPSVRLLTDAAVGLLTANPNLTVYESVVDTPPPADEDGVVYGYVVFHPGIGNDTTSNLAVEPGQLLWSFQATCVGGTAEYCGWAVDAVRARVAGQTLAVAGAKVGLIQPPVGYNPPMRPSPADVKPPRVSVPLQYQVLAVPAP